MTTKSERITILVTLNFKAFFKCGSKKEGVSISELVQNRCEYKAKNDDEALLLELIKEVNTTTKRLKDHYLRASKMPSPS